MIRRLTAEETANVYHSHLEYDFPPDERRPLSWILSLSEQGKYLTVGSFDAADQLVAYAFFGKSSSGKTLMMDYFAQWWLHDPSVLQSVWGGLSDDVYTYSRRLG